MYPAKNEHGLVDQNSKNGNMCDKFTEGLAGESFLIRPVKKLLKKFIKNLDMGEIVHKIARLNQHL
jgi:hypothetical protein